MWRRGLVVVAVLSACSRGSDESAPRSAMVASGGAPVERGASESMSDAAAPQQRAIAAGFATPSAAAPTAPAVQRMIVRTADISLQVSDVRRATQQVADATREVEGFLGASRLWREGELDRASMTVRVPAAKLDATLARLRGMAVRVDNESVTGEDVTRQAVDLTAQLTNLRATETELRALLVTVRQKTQKASDVLEVHTELSRVRGEIEQRTAELQSLTQLAALSTITLDLRPDVVATPIASATWQPRGVLRDATRALLATSRSLVNGLIWAVVYGGPMVLLVGGLVFVARALRSRRTPRETRVA